MFIFNSRFSMALRVLCLVLICAATSEATIRTVSKTSGPYTSIKAAITASNNGDTISITPDTYNESNIDLQSKTLTITSSDGVASTCIVQSNINDQSTFWIQADDSPASVIDGLTIRGDADFRLSGGAMYVNAGITVKNCVISNSYAKDGGGVYVTGCRPKFENCKFINNRSVSGDGGAAYVYHDSVTVFSNCVFTQNDATGSGANGDVIYVQGAVGMSSDAIHPATAYLINCTVVGNNSSNTLIYQYDSVMPMILTNTIVIASSTSDEAVESLVSGLSWFVQAFLEGLLGTGDPFPDPTINNTYISGNYDVNSASSGNIYTPGTSGFNVGFFNSGSGDYHLTMASSCIDAGGNGSSADMDRQPRPYYLGSGTDVGADEFNFCYLVDHEAAGTNWFNVTASQASPYRVDTARAIRTTVQTGKIRFYRILAPASGVLRIWSDNAGDLDLKGMLVEDCNGTVVRGNDDNGGDGSNFKIDYTGAEAGMYYYLAVTNKSSTQGTFDLYVRIETDGLDNICSNSVSATEMSFPQTYFNAPAGEKEKSADGVLDFEDDIDHFKIALTQPGTLMITSKTGTEPDQVLATLKDENCLDVATNVGTDSIIIEHDNRDGTTYYLAVEKNRDYSFSGTLSYGFTVRYYPLDDRVNEVTSAITPESWTDGGVATGGSVVSSSPLEGLFTLKGNGIDIGSDTFDEFYYVGKQVAGDFVLTANVVQLAQASGVTLSPEAKAGVMLREILDKSSRCGLSSITASNGFKFNLRSQYDSTGTTLGTNASESVPEWLRIQREDNTVTAFYSNNGTDWFGYGNAGSGTGVYEKQFMALDETLAHKTYAMLAVTSNDPTRDMTNIPGHNNYTYRCKIDHTSSQATRPRDLVVSMAYSGLGTKYYICQKDHTAVDNFPNDTDNRPRLANVKVGTKDFECIGPHTSSESNRPRAYHYVSYSNGVLGTRYYRCIRNNYDETPYNWLGQNNTTYWTVITENDYNVVSAGDKQEWNSSTYYGPPNGSDWTPYWRVAGTAATSQDDWAVGRVYSSAWKPYWRLDSDATSCDCGSLSSGDCSSYTCTWTAGTDYSISWLDYWAATAYTATNGTYVTNWANATLYETGQYASAQFTGVSLDTRDIVFIGGVGTETGHITVPGDSDVFEFVADSFGTITAQTTGCAAGQEAKISIYNFLGEKILDNGGTITGTGNYRITEALVTASDDAPTLTPAPFRVSPGRYYLRVTALNGHTTPFEYGVTMTFTQDVSDDHGNYKQNATILRKWTETVPTAPLLYFKKESGTIVAANDTDYFRVDLPYQGTLKVMSDWAESNLPVNVQLIDSLGNVLSTKTDVRAANPHYPQSLANFPEWDAAAHYIVGEIVRYTDGKYYKCIIENTNQPDLTHWAEVATPPANIDGIISRTLSPGTYYLKVTGAAGTNYLLSVDLDDFGNDVADASEARTHYEYNSFNGHFETVKSQAFQWSYDADAFKLVVTASGNYTIYTEGTADTYGVLKDSAGNTLAQDADSGEGRNFSYSIALAPGTYYIAMCMQDTTKPGDYTLHIDQIDDWSDIHTGARVGSLPAEYKGVIEEPGDIDYFRFTAASSGRVRVAVTGSIDIMLRLGDTSDNRLVYSSSGAVEYDVTAGNVYYVSAKPQFAMNTGTYTLSYAIAQPTNRDNDGLNDSQGNGYDTARQLTFSGNTASFTTGGVDLENDDDYYYFDVTGPGILRVYTTGTTDTYGYLFLNKDGMYHLVVSNDDSDYDKTDGYNCGMDYYVSSTVGQVRRFYVKIRGYAPHETGDYQLFIRFTPGTDDHGDECPAATHTVVQNGHLTIDEGHIGITGDRDYFRIVAGPDGENHGTVTLYTTDGDTAIDSFGYLKDEMCGTLALNDNGSGVADGDNFRIQYTPSCSGADCVPRTYYGVVKSYNDSQVGTYDLHVLSNGASVDPVSTTTLDMTASGIRYFGFEAPAEGSYLTASVTAAGGLAADTLRFTLMNGKGQVISGYENIAVTSPIYARNLDRGIHYIRISNTAGTSGNVTLNLICSGTGSIGFGNGAGTFSATSNAITLTADGTPGFTGTSDNGYFVFANETDGFDFITKMSFDTYTANTQAGIQIRQALANGTLPANAAHVTMMVTRNASNNAWNAVTRYRPGTGIGTTSYPSSPSAITLGAGNSYYVRMHYDRKSNKFTTGYSADGLTWVTSLELTMSFNDPMAVGFVYASGSDGTTRNVTFSNTLFGEIPYDDTE